MLVAAARRFLYLIALSSAVTVAFGGLLALAMGSSWERALSLGFYGIGCFLLLAGFFVGNRGPARLKNDEDAAPLLMPFFGRRRLRWATAEEQGTAISDSAIFVTLGLVLILIGVAVDTRYDLF
jgi:hypothetical protein